MISGVLKKIAGLAWFLPGFLLWAAFPPMGEKTDVLFALAPLLWLSRRADVKTSVWRWFLNGLLFWIATLSWMPAIVKNGGPLPLVLLGWFGLAAYCSAYFAAYGWLSATYWTWVRNQAGPQAIRLSNNQTIEQSSDQEIKQSNNQTIEQFSSYGLRLLGVLIVEPILWCGLELVRSRFVGGFAWNQIGVVPVNGGFGAPAALGGVYLCSAVVILINGTFAGIAERVWKPERSGFPVLRKLGTLETILAFALVWGVYGLAGMGLGHSTFDSRQTPGEETARTAHLKVALVQRNFPCVFKRGERSDPYEVYGKLLQNVSALKPDIVVLAESAMCEFGPVDQQGAVRFAEWASGQCGGAAVLAGGTRFGDGREYNSAALYVSNAAPESCFAQESRPAMSVEFYDKVHLVPFGEYIPGDKIITALQKLAPVGSCTPGELKLLSLPLPSTLYPLPSTLYPLPSTLSLGVAICFEDTDSAQMRELAKKGAKVLFFITNDSWFSHSNESVQHAWQAVARAVETGLPVVRVGNSGVSGTIQPDGRAAWLIGSNGKALVDRAGTMLDRIALPQAQVTPYVRVGDVPLAVAFALLIFALIMVKYKAHHE